MASSVTNCPFADVNSFTEGHNTTILLIDRQQSKNIIKTRQIMKYRKLAKTDLLLSEVTFGAWAAGGWKRS